MIITQEKIEISNKISAEDFCELRSLVGFQNLTKEQANKVLKNTSYLAVVRYNNICIGIVRLLFDYGTDAYITDVIVHPNYQGNGIGKLLVANVLNYIKNECPNTRVACSIYANPDKELFYGKLGFEQLPNSKYGHGMLIEIN